MINWAGIIGICACVAGVLVGKLCNELPLPYPAHVRAEDLHPDHLPAFGTPEENNTRLLDAVKLFEGKIQGSESVAIAPDGALVMCDKFGYVWRAPPNDAGSFDLEEAPLGHLGPGRPLGFHFDNEGGLVVCMAGAGLVRMDINSGAVEVLTSRVSADDMLSPGSAVDYANDVAVASNGIIYFTDSVQGVSPVKNAQGFWDTLQAYMLTLFNGEATGRLLSYNPATRATHVVAPGLWFANGVALSADESFAAVVETNTQRLHKVGLSGAKAGQSEVLAERLPGFPDGITTGAGGSFWVGIVAPELPALRFLGNKYARFLAAWLPKWALPTVKEWGAVVEVGPDGQILQALYDAEGSHISYVSAVTEAGDRLYFGNLAKDYVSFINLEAPKKAAA